MINNIKNLYIKLLRIIDFNFEPSVKNIVGIGIKVSFIIMLFATLIMSIYISSNHSYILYNLGITLFRTSSMFIAMFLVNGIAFNTILKGQFIKR